MRPQQYGLKRSRHVFDMYMSAILLAGVMLAQLLSGPFLLLNHFDDNYTIGAGPATLWILGCVLLSFLFGLDLWGKCYRAYLQRYRAVLLDRLYHWGMLLERHNEKPASIKYLIFLAMWGGLSIWATEGSVIESVNEVMEGSSFGLLLFYCLVMMLMPLVLEWQLVQELKKTADELDDLNPLFRCRFSPAELLSMYHAMKGAPPIYWNEYIKLPDHVISDRANKRYRDMVASYYARKNQRTQNLILGIALVAVAISLPPLIVAIVDAGWIRDLLEWLELAR